MVKPQAQIDAIPGLEAYHSSLESRIGYRFLLGGTRHFGYYQSSSSKLGFFSAEGVTTALRAMEQKLYEALSLPPGSKVLDAGCGAGLVALFLARKGLLVTAIDYMPSHVEKARGLVGRFGMGERVSVERMDYHHLETIPDASHDGVVTMETLVHATDVEKVVAGFYRVLKPGGRIALHEYENSLDDPSASAFWARKGRAVPRHAYLPTADRATPGFWKGLLEEAGFVDVVVRDYSENVRPMLLLFFVLAFVPFLVVEMLGLERVFVNTLTGVTAFVGRRYWRYVSVSGRKPDGVDGLREGK